MLCNWGCISYVKSRAMALNLVEYKSPVQNVIAYERIACLLLVTGSGDDTIKAGPGTGVIVVNKTSGSIHVKPGRGLSGSVVWESRRIDYQGDALTTQGTVTSDKVALYGSHGHHDILRMTAYNSTAVKRLAAVFCFISRDFIHSEVET